MLERRSHLRSYLIGTVGDLIRRGVVKPTDLSEPEKVIVKVVAEFTKDVRADIGAVLADIGSTVAEYGLRRVADVSTRVLGDLFTGLAEDMRKRRQG